MLIDSNIEDIDVYKDGRHEGNPKVKPKSISGSWEEVETVIDLYLQSVVITDSGWKTYLLLSLLINRTAKTEAVQRQATPTIHVPTVRQNGGIVHILHWTTGQQVKWETCDRWLTEASASRSRSLIQTWDKEKHQDHSVMISLWMCGFRSVSHH